MENAFLGHVSNGFEDLAKDYGNVIFVNEIFILFLFV